VHETPAHSPASTPASRGDVKHRERCRPGKDGRCATRTIGIARATSGPTPMNDSDQRYEQLRMRYASSLASKHGDLAQAWRAFAANPGEDSAHHELHVQIHHLSGSAPAYSYTSLGARARAADELMSQHDAPGASLCEAPADLVARLAAPIHAVLTLSKRRMRAPRTNRQPFPDRRETAGIAWPPLLLRHSEFGCPPHSLPCASGAGMGGGIDSVAGSEFVPNQ
jgi:hypothetical protein